MREPPIKIDLPLNFTPAPRFYDGHIKLTNCGVYGRVQHRTAAALSISSLPRGHNFLRGPIIRCSRPINNEAREGEGEAVECETKFFRRRGGSELFYSKFSFLLHR
jgi:hypothetical protein